PFKADEELPNPLPPGAHRVISTMTAAEMRKMMEGVVLYGTGKEAQLNGYSSGGKTGTAQKVDPATHLYSKTMHIASFAGIAPVNNPVIAVAVVLDSPKGLYYGASVSAPVFAEVAQQVLEYLGVPHDIDIKPQHAPTKTEVVKEDDSDADQDNVNALFAAVNDLPPDDPLRAPAAQQQDASQSTSVVAAQTKSSGTTAPSPPNPATAATLQVQPSPQKPVTQVTISDGTRLTVPSLVGLPVRKVIELAAAAGLDVQVTGSGTAREQAPPPGTIVHSGTKIVVRCQR
ncbi:MAG: penicillin-binding transpeptidase domain-containing protein, partial [Terracidiphilus sp.]